MKLLRFLFPFLYTRNWHTGELELSRPRAYLFGIATTVVVLGLVMITILQLPVEYSVTS